MLESGRWTSAKARKKVENSPENSQAKSERSYSTWNVCFNQTEFNDVVFSRSYLLSFLLISVFFFVPLSCRRRMWFFTFTLRQTKRLHRFRNYWLWFLPINKIKMFRFYLFFARIDSDCRQINFTMFSPLFSCYSKNAVKKKKSIKALMNQHYRRGKIDCGFICDVFFISTILSKDKSQISDRKKKHERKKK